MTSLAQPAARRGFAPSVTRFLLIKREKFAFSRRVKAHRGTDADLSPFRLPFLFEAGALKLYYESTNTASPNPPLSYELLPPGCFI